ncbi:MAG TPA: AsmA family protein [Hyphomicrobiaceae bacterium]|nr:AsmA family protein [Hyphomicrobiaceae bacterium]
MNNLLIGIAFFLITIVGALFAVPYFIDWNSYRGVFEEEATHILGREVRVGGAVNLHLLPTPYFRLEKVRIADDTALDAIFKADSLTVKLSVPPLFRGVVEANEIEMQRPVVRLAVNEKGAWNWQRLTGSLGEATYFPTNITLTSVKLTDATLGLYDHKGEERLRVEGLNGEFSAPSLNGPYRFQGVFGKPGQTREIRVATALSEPQEGTRFRASLRLDESGSLYTLNARLHDAATQPRVEGELTARLPISGLLQAASSQPSAPRRPPPAADELAANGGEPSFDLKAALKADADGAQISDLALSFEQDGKPQLITGDVSADWRDALIVKMNLASRWLDLDRISGARDATGPLQSVVTFATRVRELLPGVRSETAIAVDQANLGKDSISGLSLLLRRSKAGVELQHLRAGMPGGSRVDMSGNISGPPDAPVFEGDLALRGASLGKFVSWASGTGVTADVKTDGSFGVRTHLSIEPGKANARDLIGDVAGTEISGSVQYQWQGRPSLALSLEGPRLDVRSLMSSDFSLADIYGLLVRPSQKPGGNGSRDHGEPAWAYAPADTSIRVNFGEMLSGQHVYRDVAAQVRLMGGRLTVPSLKVASDDGFTLELAGTLDNAAEHPKGSVRGVVTAASGAAFVPLAGLLGIPAAFIPDAPRAGALAPLHLAGTMAFGARKPTSIDLTLDGEAAGGQTRVRARFDGGTEGWRDGLADLTGTIQARDAAHIAALLGAKGEIPSAANKIAGQVLIKANGVPSKGLTSIVSIAAGATALNFRGQLATGENGSHVAGDLELKAADSATLAAIAGLAPPLHTDGLPVSGTARVETDGGAITLTQLSLKLGDENVRGRLALASTGAQRRVDAHLQLDDIAASKLLAALLDQRLAITNAAESVISGQRQVWPNEPFDAAVLDGLAGTIELKTSRLSLADGIGLDQARLKATLEPGRVNIAEIEGTGLGGKVTGALRVEKAAGGVEIGGQFKLSKGSFGGPSEARGSMDATLDFTGSGNSPRAVISSLQGRGSLQFHDMSLDRLWPGAIAKAAEAAFKANPEDLGTTINQVLSASLSSGKLPLGSAPVKLEIAGGRIAAQPWSLATSEGRATGSASLDLATFRFTSDWRLQEKPVASEKKGPLPAVIVKFDGPLAALPSLPPQIDSDSLQRELSVRRMERDVEELERLRRLDEERRRSEANRLRELQQAPPPYQPAPPGIGPVAPRNQAPSQGPPATPG